MAELLPQMYEHGLYLGVFIAPFVQEDAAMIGAAAASASGAGSSMLLFLTLVLGTTCSDTWKYWAGRAAHLSPWAARIAAKPAVTRAQSAVVRRLFLTMLVARFVPGTRIPLYVAAGVFKAPFWRFFIYVIVTAVAYASVAFALLHLVGAAAGEAAAHYAPAIAVVMVIAVIAVSWWRGRLARRAVAAEAP